MKREIEFSPGILIKEKDGSVNSAIVVDNGPALMEDTKEDGRQYTEAFHDLIEHFPTILTAAFYGKGYTSYRLKLEGEDFRSLVGIKKFMMGYGKEE
jgi:hypothetical protein